MSVSSLPSVDRLVDSVKGRTKRRHSLQRYGNPQYEFGRVHERYPMQKMQEGNTGLMSAIVWDSNDTYPNENQDDMSYPNQSSPLDYQTIRNLRQSHEEMELIPHVPHRKMEGERMKKIIYDAHYRNKPLHPSTKVNYDNQYMKHQKMYQDAYSQTNKGHKPKSSSRIDPGIERDRKSGKHYTKFAD